MTDREAMEAIEYARVLNRKHTPLNLAVDMAYEALKEREERSKTCHYCCYETVPEDKWSDGVFSGIVGNTEYLGCDDDAHYNDTRKIHFCPMCGKPLKEDE